MLDELYSISNIRERKEMLGYYLTAFCKNGLIIVVVIAYRTNPTQLEPRLPALTRTPYINGAQTHLFMSRAVSYGTFHHAPELLVLKCLNHAKYTQCSFLNTMYIKFTKDYLFHTGNIVKPITLCYENFTTPFWTGHQRPPFLSDHENSTT